MIPRKKYLQIRQQNDQTKSVTMSTRARRRVNILENSKQYFSRVESLSIPVDTIPILNFKENEYELALEFDGASVTKFLEFIPSRTSDIGKSTGLMFENEYFVQSLNNALQQAYDDLLVLKPGILATGPPFVVIQSGKLSLYAELAYETVNPNPVDIIFDHSLLKFFDCFDSFELGSDRHLIKIVDTKVNIITSLIVDYFRMEQNFDILPLWNTIHKVQLAADLPINSEMKAGQADVTNQILSDFQVVDTVNRAERFTYIPESEINQYQLITNLPLNSYNISVQAVLNDGSVVDLTLSKDEYFSLKLSFERTVISTLNLLMNVDD